MPYSKLRFFKRCAEFLERDKIKDIPRNTRGIYSLMIKNKDIYETVYIGMASGPKAGMRGRILSHSKSKRKNANKNTTWTHFSIYEVFENISIQEIKELEGLLRHLYRKSDISNPLNMHRRFVGFTKIKNNNLKNW